VKESSKVLDYNMCLRNYYMPHMSLYTKHIYSASNLKSKFFTILVSVAFSILVSEVCLINI